MENAPVVLPIELTPAQVRPVAYRVISKKHGLNLKSPALVVLSRFLGHHFGADWRGPQAEKSLDEISRKWKNEERGIFVDGPELSQVIKDWLNAEASSSLVSNNHSEKKFDWRQYFKVVSATEQKRVIYDNNKKNFVVPNDAGPSPFGPAKSLTSVFASRYYVLLDKLYRSEKFAPSGLANPIRGTTSHILTPIKNLLGRSQEEAFYLFGLLEKQKDGPWTLYDPTSSIELEFGNYSNFFPHHYYTSGSFVICSGQIYGSSFLVTMMGPPPVETRFESQEAYGHLDFYGLHGLKSSKRLERIDPALESILIGEEEKMLNNRIVFLGADLFLDKEAVIDALRRLFTTKLETNPPIALVLCGSFVSVPFQPHMTTQDGRSAAQIYRDGMNNLADVLQQCPNLSKNTKLIFVPGPNDPWHSMSLSVLPYQPLPSVFTGRIDHVASDVVWATNPTRLCYLSQEILLYRSNCGDILRRNSLDIEVYQEKAVDTNSTASTGMSNIELAEDEADKFTTLDESSLVDDDDSERAADRAAVRAMFQQNRTNHASNLNAKTATSDIKESRAVLTTLLDQCHLSPLPMSLSPVMWEYDHSLSMAQWPNTLALFDPSSPRTKQTYEGCHILNVGDFWHNGSINWMEFWPTEGNSKFMELM